MTGRISIPALRENKYPRVDRGRLLPEGDLLALVEAVEAARDVSAMDHWMHGSEKWTSVDERLRVALARFDFGEEA